MMTAALPLTVMLRMPPLPHFVRERNRHLRRMHPSRNEQNWRMTPELRFLSPGQGGPKDGRDRRLAPARWHAKRDGEGVLAAPALAALDGRLDPVVATDLRYVVPASRGDSQ